MDVELPASGCNILISESSFYNYSPDSRTRQRFYIYQGVAHLQSVDVSQYPYSYTGTCLNTGDLVYKPEIRIYFEFMSLIIVFFVFYLLFQLIFRRLRWRS